MDWAVTHRPETWGGKELAYPHVPPEHPKFAQSVTVGNLVFLSGFVGLDGDTGRVASGVAAQVTLALDNTRAAMAAAGSSLDNIVKTFFTVTNLDDYPLIRRTETEYYERHAPYLVAHPPAATLIVVSSLARPELLLEYEAVGVVDRTAADWEVSYYPEYWNGRQLAYPHVPKDHAKFARSEVVGNLVFVSGCQALNHDTVRVETSDFAEQTLIVMEKIRTGMEEAGGSIATLLKTNVLLDDIADLPKYREVERTFFAKHAPGADPPASTVIAAKSLPRPEFLVEVEAIGAVDAGAANWPTLYCPGDENASRSVSSGKLVFLSACDGANPATGGIETENFAEQMLIALDKVRTALEEAGSSMEKIVKTLLMLRRLEDYSEMRRTELAYLQKYAPKLVAKPPASTLIQLPALSHPKSLFQIDVTATR
ncbi:MAG: RidA family protein [Alphaproteobacteria bacterium]|nr:RidA family protein [Alphaproteobacteria bacterium]